MKRVLIGIDIPEDNIGTLPAILEKMAGVLRTEERRSGDVSIAQRGPRFLRLEDDDEADYTKIGRWRVEVDDVDRWKHLKRGTSYDVIGTLTVQTDKPLTDGAVLTVYSSVADGEIFGRPPLEFYHPDRFVQEIVD